MTGIRDTISYKKSIPGDSVISDTGFIEDSIIEKYTIKDSTKEIPEIQIVDSTVPDTLKVKPIHKAAEKPLMTSPAQQQREKLTWNTAGNFLFDSQRKDTSSAGMSLLTPVESSAGNLKRILIHDKNITIEPKKRYEISNDWFLGLFLFITLLFLWVKIFYKKYFNLLFSSLLSYQLSIKLLREKNVMIKRISFVLNFIYVIVLSAFILKILEQYHIKIFGFNTFETLLIIINTVIIISVARILLLKLVGFIFDSTQIFNEYIHNNYVINKNLGLILFPLLIAQVYISEKLKVIFIIAGISLILISYIIRLYRGFQIIIKKDIFLFYLILYLCTLEILPLLLGYKFFILLI
jgi:hypothetical protein